MSEFSFSYTVPGQKPPAAKPKAPALPSVPEDPTLWSFTGVELVPMGSELTLLVDRISGKRLMVRPEVATTLTHCEPYRTLRQHAEYLVSVLPPLGGQVEPVIPVLAHIRDAGLMRSANDTLSQLTAPLEQSKLPPVQVFIITCDRPAAVERLIASMEHQAGLDLPECYWLIDDSRDPANQAHNAELVSACNDRGALQFTYFGLKQRNQLISHLCSALPECADAVRFLLDQTEWTGLPTYGISRSLALLLGVGKRVVVLDDDILCEAVRPPLPGTGLQFGSVRSRAATFYGSAEELSQSKQLLRDNPITLIARQLGVGLSSALRSLQHGAIEADSLQGANGAFVRSLNPQSPILKTQCSSWGDPGTSSGHWVVELDDHSIGRLLDSPAGLSATVDGRNSWLGYTGPTLAKHGVMSQMTGYDASQLLPPFMPALRGEDNLFALMLAAVHPNSLVLNHDWAVPHLPLEARGQRSLRAPIPQTGGLGLLTQWIGDHVDLSEGIAPATRLSRIAQSVAELSELSKRDILNFGRVELARAQASQLGAYQQQLARAKQFGSDNWTQYLKRGQQELMGALREEPSLSQLFGFNISNEDEALQKAQFLGLRFAQALRSWPAIWKCAAEFRL